MNYKYSLKNIHSFGLNTFSNKILKVNSVKEILNLINILILKNIKWIIIGNGTNSIFLNNFYGFVILNRIKGKKILNYKNYWILHINSGESWNKLVIYTFKKKMFGLENLVMIPGRVGAAPIYNIGAYGQEFKNFCIYVDVLNLKNKKIIRFYKNMCRFSYRNSIFQNLNSQYFILSIGIKINKKWKPNLNHKSLSELKHYKNLTPKRIFLFISKLRKNNIPNYKIFKNSGSFFKNIILNINNTYCLNKFKDMPYVFYKKNIKIFTAWLIEKCNLKDKIIKNLKISKINPLIIINFNNANSNNLIYLIKLIYIKIIKKFNLKLELEVSLIFNNKKINIDYIINKI